MSDARFVVFERRGVVAVGGSDARKFLNDLITSEIDRTNNGGAAYGRVIRILETEFPIDMTANPASSEVGNLPNLTVPTGRVTAPADAAVPDDVLFQPFIGYVVNFGDLYVHAFHSVLVPTNSSDVTLFANDVGFG